MKEVLLLLIQQLNSSVFVLMLILGTIIFGIYHMGRWQEKFKNQDIRIEKVSGLYESFIELKTKIDIIFQNTRTNPLYLNKSPVSLTDRGHQIKNKLKMENILDKYFDRLKGYLSKENSGNAYDIQQKCFDIAKEKLEKMLDATEIIHFKDEAFIEGLIIEDLLMILGILFRDRILEEKDIPVSDIDRHSPNN